MKFKFQKNVTLQRFPMHQLSSSHNKEMIVWISLLLMMIRDCIKWLTQKITLKMESPYKTRLLQISKYSQFVIQKKQILISLLMKNNSPWPFYQMEIVVLIFQSLNLWIKTNGSFQFVWLCLEWFSYFSVDQSGIYY